MDKEREVNKMQKNEDFEHWNKIIQIKKSVIEGVAQLAAAADSRSAGWGFESLRPQILFKYFSFFFFFFFFFNFLI